MKILMEQKNLMQQRFSIKNVNTNGILTKHRQNNLSLMDIF
jgi:hypothetical protein